MGAGGIAEVRCGALRCGIEAMIGVNDITLLCPRHHLREMLRGLPGEGNMPMVVSLEAAFSAIDEVVVATVARD